MLTDAQLEIISSALIPLFQYLEKEVITDIAGRIEKSLTYSRTAELEAIAMRELGYSPARIRKEAMKILNADLGFQKAVAENTLAYKKAVKDMLAGIIGEAYGASEDILTSAGDLSWENDLGVWEDEGKTLSDRSYLSELVGAFKAQTDGELKNMTETTGFKTVSGYEALENAYRRELDKAVIKICSGTFSKEKVIEDVIHDLAQSGLRSIDFASGYSMQLDTAVRLAIRTGCHQLSARITDQNILQTGVNLVYVSKHWGARNTGTGHANHEQWQGKVYFVKEGTDYSGEAKRIGQERIMSLWYATGYSIDGSRTNDPLGLNGYNCRHNYYPWFEGSSSLPDEDPEPAPVTVNGKTYDYYAMTQKMRAMERAVRALKREKEALKELGMDTTEIQAKISRKTAEYKEFCRTCGIPENTSRLRYECGTSDLKKTKAWNGFEVSAAPFKKKVAETFQSDTIDTSESKGNVEVHTVGKIDREIYKCITEDLRTEDVIITDERIQHIKERHPNDYERFCGYLTQIVEKPDYIVETNKPNTALVLKEFTYGSEQFKTVVRLTTSCDNPDFKNSIITFMKINEKEWSRLLRNKLILYKRE